jgi:hypothetical protein
MVSLITTRSGTGPDRSLNSSHVQRTAAEAGATSDIRRRAPGSAGERARLQPIRGSTARAVGWNAEAMDSASSTSTANFVAFIAMKSGTKSQVDFLGTRFDTLFLLLTYTYKHTHLHILNVFFISVFFIRKKHEKNAYHMLVCHHTPTIVISYHKGIDSYPHMSFHTVKVLIHTCTCHCNFVTL